MSSPNGFYFQSWADMQNEALASQRQAEALDEFMAEAEEIDDAMKQLLEDLK